MPGLTSDEDSLFLYIHVFLEVTGMQLILLSFTTVFMH